MQGLTEAANIRIVEGGVDLVEHAKWTGLDHVNGEEQRDGSHGALTTREKCHAFKAGAWRSCDYFNTRLQRIVGVDELEVRLATARDLSIGEGKIFLHLFNN